MCRLWARTGERFILSSQRVRCAAGLRLRSNPSTKPDTPQLFSAYTFATLGALLSLAIAVGIAQSFWRGEHDEAHSVAAVVLCVVGCGVAGRERFYARQDSVRSGARVRSS